MKACCYYHNVSDQSYPGKLIECWAASWRANGFDPVILQESDARRNGKFLNFNRLVESLPTVNDKRYERHCWVRWMAFEDAAPAMFTDYDVFNFGFSPNDVVNISEGLIVGFQDAVTPMFYADKFAVRLFISMSSWASASLVQIDGHDHISDMHFVKSKCMETHVKLCCVGTEVGRPDEMKAPLVHFANSHLPEELRFGSRWRAAEDLYRRRGMTPPWEKA